MDFVSWFQTTEIGKFISTMLVAMAPVVELRGAIPVGVAMDLPLWAALLASIIGNMIPVPFIIIFIRRIFKWISVHFKRLHALIERLEKRAHTKGEIVRKYQAIGLCILVAIPLPGTGAWTGALVAAFLDMRLKTAFPVILLGVIIAGILVSGLTYGFTAIF